MALFCLSQKYQGLIRGYNRRTVVRVRFFGVGKSGYAAASLLARGRIRNTNHSNGEKRCPQL
jgi:hypothetical protein